MMTRKSKSWLIAALTSSLALFGCAPVDLLNTITPSGSFKRVKDISYGQDVRHKLDIYRPDTAQSQKPLLVYVHGGGWNDGDKSDYKFLAENFARDGYTVIVPNYRLHPNSVFPDPVTDTALAVSWVTQEYADRPIVLMGHSAGAYNVLMTALAPQYLAELDIDLCQHVAGVISLAGPTGIVPLEEEPYVTVFPERFTGTDAPLNNVKAPAPPFLLLHGQNDRTVYPQNSTRLSDKIRERGGKVKTIVYRGIDHIDIVRVLSRFFDNDADVKQDILAYLETLDTTQSNYCQ